MKWWEGLKWLEGLEESHQMHPKPERKKYKPFPSSHSSSTSGVPRASDEENVSHQVLLLGEWFLWESKGCLLLPIFCPRLVHQARQVIDLLLEIKNRIKHHNMWFVVVRKFNYAENVHNIILSKMKQSERRVQLKFNIKASWNY